LTVRLVQSVRDLNRTFQKLIDFQRSARQALGERFTLEKLHDDEVDIVVVTNIVKGADVRVIQGRNSASLAVEALAHFGTRRDLRRKYLDGDDAVESRVSGFVNLAHAAGPDEGDELVWPKAGLRGETHVAIIAPGVSSGLTWVDRSVSVVSRCQSQDTQIARERFSLNHVADHASLMTLHRVRRLGDGARPCSRTVA
jgi:hypothetical protein